MLSQKENYASYPGDLSQDPVNDIVHHIKNRYTRETGKYIPLSENFKNSTSEISNTDNNDKKFNLFKSIKKGIENITKKEDNNKKQDDNQEQKDNNNKKQDDNQEQKDDTKKNNEDEINTLSQEKDKLESQLQKIQDNINNNISIIDKKDKEITEKKVRGLMQKREILDKLNVVETRNRMLQLSEEKNIYKTKVINTMIAVILGGLTISALFYVRRQKK
jgi:uncharacterized protein (DUF3084 family)